MDGIIDVLDGGGGSGVGDLFICSWPYFAVEDSIRPDCNCLMEI